MKRWNDQKIARTRPASEELTIATAENRTTGTESGQVGTIACPSFERYAHVPAHKGTVLDLVPAAGGALSLSKGQFKVHTTGEYELG